VTSSLRGYIGFRNQTMADATDNYLNRFERLLIKIAGQKRVELTIEEEDGLEILGSQYEAYREYFMVVKGIHSGETWRMDIWLMKNEILPVFESLDNELIAISDLAVANVEEMSNDVLQLSLNSIIILLLLSAIGQIAGMVISNRVTHSELV